MHPEEETTHPLNPFVHDAEERMLTDVFTQPPEVAGAIGSALPPRRRRRHPARPRQTAFWASSAFTGAVLVAACVWVTLVEAGVS